MEAAKAKVGARVRYVGPEERLAGKVATIYHVGQNVVAAQTANGHVIGAYFEDWALVD